VHEAMRTPLIVDGRNVLDPQEVAKQGFSYEGIGRVSFLLRRDEDRRAKAPALD
jgi:hypothetical protein